MKEGMTRRMPERGSLVGASPFTAAGTPLPDWPAEQHTKQAGVRQALLTTPRLTAVELSHGSGVILGTRRP